MLGMGAVLLEVDGRAGEALSPRVARRDLGVLAADALYFAAFDAFQFKQYDAVLEDSVEFKKQFAEHEFAKDVEKLVEESRVLKSVDLFKDEKFAESVELLAAVVAANPEGKRAAESLLLLARSQARLEKYDEAKASIGKLISCLLYTSPSPRD